MKYDYSSLRDSIASIFRAYVKSKTVTEELRMINSAVSRLPFVSNCKLTRYSGYAEIVCNIFISDVITRSLPSLTLSIIVSPTNTPPRILHGVPENYQYSAVWSNEYDNNPTKIRVDWEPIRTFDDLRINLHATVQTLLDEIPAHSKNIGSSLS